MTLQKMAAVICVCLVGCGREKGSGIAADVSTFGPNGEIRIYAADQDSSGTRMCFESADTTLPEGAPVTVVHATFPQYATTGTLGKRSKSPCFPPPRASADSIEYAIEAPADTFGRHGVPIIVLGALPKAQMRGDTVMLAVEQGKASWRFRTCASEEGIHATAWSGPPLTAPRRWHAYYYLGYDVEPNCTAADGDTPAEAAKSK